MKTIGIIAAFLLLIVVAGAWFVNREWNALENTSVEPQNRSIQPITEEEPAWQFAVVGDTEDVRPVNQQMIEDMAERDLAFVAHLGDISSHAEEDKMQEVLDLFATLPFPTYYVPGNNDLIYDETTERKTTALYQRLVNNELYYSIDHENMHLVFLDNSYMRTGFADDELAWLKEDLDANTKPFTMLFYHRPLSLPFEEWFGDDETDTSRPQNEKFKELIRNYSINRIFNGHIHTTLTYTLNETMPVTVSGGGGAEPQAVLGGADAVLYHYYIVSVYDSETEPTIQMVTL